MTRASHSTGAALCAAARLLLAQQQQSWPTLAANVRALAGVHTRDVNVDDLTFRLQFNPARLVSTAAQVDAQSLAARPCFLCQQNLPPEQRALDAGDGWRILANPFPILPEHFTIPRVEHTPQRIFGQFSKMLELARGFGSEFAVLYNGPQCGASAPDHLHFQAGNAGQLPLFDELHTLAGHFGQRVGGLTIVSSPLRPFALIEGQDHIQIAAEFDRFVSAWRRADPGSDEPMMNILATHHATGYCVIVIPRTRHRPAFYHADGDQRILLSPASIDLAGLCVVPLERDFARLRPDHIRQMLAEVCPPGEQMRQLADDIARR